MKHRLLLFAALLLSVLTIHAQGDTLRLSSPNGRLTATFFQRATTGTTDAGTPCTLRETLYTLSFDGTPVLEPSRLGLDMDNRVWEMALGQRRLPQYDCWMDALQVDSFSVAPVTRGSYQPLWGERAVVPDVYASAVLHLSRHPEPPAAPSAPLGVTDGVGRDGLTHSGYRLDIDVRLYDGALAFRYRLPEHPSAIFHKVVADETRYTFPSGTTAWGEQWAQGGYEPMPVDSLLRPVVMPLLLHLPTGAWTALLAADTDDWCLTTLAADAHASHTLTSILYSPVDVVTYASTPWKVVMVGDSPSALVEGNAVVELLNDPLSVDDAADWVRPGTIMRETTLTMDGARRTIDFCARHGIDYMLFDAGWYQPWTSHDGDASRTIERLDMPAVCRYAADHGVGVWLYVNQHALMQQADTLFPLLRQWGVVGVKSGFVQFASHRWAVWLHDLVRLAADNHLMMNIHDEYRPTGFSRTYPNLLTQEGICGGEEFPDASHDVTLAFTRMLCGPADYTICWHDRRLANTHGHQMAAALTYYTPLLTLYWYDRPEYFDACPDDPALAWFDALPTTWDETRCLGGTPGDYVVTARRSGTTWYLAVLGGNEGRTVDVDLLTLLGPGTYSLTRYDDDPRIATPSHVRVTTVTRRVNARHPYLPVAVAPRGGMVMTIDTQR